MLINDIHLTELNSPNQKIKARVELYKGSTLQKVCNCGDTLGEFTVEKTGEGKFFGFGICQKLRTVIFDLERELKLTKDHTIEASFGVVDNFVYPFPNFYVKEVERDEETNALTVIAYDSLYRASDYTVAQLGLAAPYTIRDFVVACSALLNIPIVIDEAAAASFDLYFEQGANFDGSENIRQALNAVAEVTQTIYYIDNNWDMVFKRLDRDSRPQLTITKNQYIDLDTNGECVLKNITHTTELEDSVSSIAGEGTEDGVTQFIRDNPFWALREDIGTLLENSQSIVGGMNIHQFECEWIGNYLLEIGDKIGLILEDNSEVMSYILDDTITFDGTLSQFTRWEYKDNSAETAENSTSLGEALNRTYARVDKVNRRIDLVASETDDKFSSFKLTTDSIEAKVQANAENIAVLQINADSITASVQAVEESTKESINSLNGSVETLTKQVNLAITAEDIKLAVKSELDNGIDKVVTSTGFTFDANGLAINKSDNAVNTLISNDGMKIFRQGEYTPVLNANEEGVKAENLHATTYLIVGNNSRFEDFDNGTRTGCFWIGR